jgi:putative hydrolase of the HAD superfamily
MIYTLFLDLDNTLYPKSSGLMDAIRDRIISYMGEIMRLSVDEIKSIRQYSLKKYGTTLIGLMELYGIDKQHYLDYVHDLDLSKYLTKDPKMVGALKAISLKKVIFSNADHDHVRRVLNYLGMDGLFDCIIDVHALMPNVKPQPEAFEKALSITELNSWDGCAFVDDYLPNILAAENLGIFSILVDEAGDQDYINKIPSLKDLKDFLNVH